MVREEIREEMRLPYYLLSGTRETTVIVLIKYAIAGPFLLPSHLRGNFVMD
jgi:hypothetical protein